MDAKCATILIVFTLFILTRAQPEYKPFANITECKETATHFQYYRTAKLECVDCPQDKSFMTVSSDGLNCICKPGYRYSINFGGGSVNCTKCADTEVRSEDGWSCVTCPLGIDTTTGQCNSCTNPSRTTPVERELNGAPVNPRVCRACQPYTWLNSDGNRCVRCTDFLKTDSTLSTCDCPNPEGGLCFPNINTALTDNVITTVPLTDGFASQKSQYLETHLKASYMMCDQIDQAGQEYHNETACQTLGNLCALTFFEYEDATPKTSACNLYKSIIRANPDWQTFLPDLYFTTDGVRAQDGDRVLDDEAITTTYTFDPQMNIKILAAQYSLDGQFLGISSVLGGLIQLCSDTTTRLNAAYVFGTYYSHSCSIPAIDLWDQTKYKPNFYDLYLDFERDGGQQIYPVPIRLFDYQYNRQPVNQEEDTKEWHLVKRFFLVDNVATTGAATGSLPEYVRYVKSININIQLIEGTTSGQIFPPYITIQYGTVSLTDAQEGNSISTSFSVDYSYVTTKYRRDFQIAVGTLSTLGIIYAGYRTWVWSKRAGKPAIDFGTIVSFLFFAAGSLANVFFVITFGIAFYFLTFFKGQNTVFLFHIKDLPEREWLALFGCAFALKCLQIIHMIVMQCTADVFLIDWERPKHVSSNSEKKTGSNVSIWRTYFVANEWNEIQTLRKINQVFQVFAVVFFLNVVGFENVVTKDPDGRIIKDSESYRAPDSTMFRYAIGASVYIVVAIVQWLFFTLIYERFIEDKVRQFVDLCSMSNISVFVMAHAQFGYYIHGKSVHGKADTNMGDMFDMMRREEEDLCGKRGLLPDTEKQTFMMALPRKLRIKYETVMLPVALESGGAVGAAGKSKEAVIATKTNAYGVVNKFLAGFVDHSLKDIDYVVKDKTLLESIMDTEFLDASEKGIFYNDDGHSFDRALFYGNESALLIFDTLLFCIVDLIFQNFVLAGVITFVITELISMGRDSGGRMNLARKTLVDQRFLI